MAKKEVKNIESVDEVLHTGEDIQGLQRDMRSAKMSAWVESKKNELIMGAAAIVLVALGSGLWVEWRASINESAASLYLQASKTQNAAQKTTLLNRLLADYDSTAFAPLAYFVLAGENPEQAETYLRQVFDHSKTSDALKHQAMIDLASIFIASGKKDEARGMLNDSSIGVDFNQERYFLLSSISENAEEKKDYLIRAKEASSYDTEIEKEILHQLAIL